MEPTPAAQIEASVAASPLLAKYGTAVNPVSATEMIDAGKPATTSEKKVEEYSDRWAEEINTRARRRGRTRPSSTSRRQSPLDRAAGEAGRTLARELIKKLFSRRR